jgi:hypothetical protein
MFLFGLFSALMSRFCHPRSAALSGSLLGTLVFALLLTGCGSGSDSDSNVAVTASSSTRETGPTVAALRPVGDSQATGTARYSKGPDGSPSIRLRADGLAPTSGAQQYVVWQKHSRDDMVLLATWPVGADGKLVEAWEPSSASLGYLEGGLRTKLLITKVEDNAQLSAPGAAENSYVHHFIGRPVLEGQFEGALVGSTEGE